MSDKKVLIIPTGFYNTGSSAVTNILQEIPGVETLEGVNEWRIIYDADGIRDLEYHLINNPHRQTTSYAIKRFKKYIDFNSNLLLNHHYEKVCNGNFKKISYEYINEISDFRYYGVSHIDMMDRGELFWFIERCYSKLIRMFFSGKRPSWVRGSLMPRKTVQYAGTYNKSKFYEATRKYIGKILAYANIKESNYLIADQFLPASAISPCLQYFPNDYLTKVIVVDRDPRDLFFTCKYYLHTKAIPTDTVELFCDWYKWTREQGMRFCDNENILRIKFEDLIYEYEKTRKLLIDFCCLDKKKCTPKLDFFDPMKSINNTQVWGRYPGHEEELSYIYDKLREYCYPFEQKKLEPNYNNGTMFDC